MSGKQNRRLGVIAIISVIVVSVFAGRVVSTKVLDWVPNIEQFGEGFYLISALLFMLFAVAFGTSWLQRQRVLLLAGVIIMLPILPRMPRLTIYTDIIGYSTYLSLTTLLTIILLFAPLPNRSSQTLRTVFHDHRALVRWFGVLITSAFLSQIVNLSPLLGISMVLIRIGVPILICLLTIEMVESLDDLKALSAAMILSLCVAVWSRFMGTNVQYIASGFGSAVSRATVQGFASWTMYGTLLATTIPVILTMIAISYRKHWRFLLWFCTALFFFEVLATHTRGALLCMIPLLFVFFNRSFIERTKLLKLLPVFILIGLLLSGRILSEFMARPLLGYRWMEDPNVIGRLYRISSSWQYIKNHPFVGIGFGSPNPLYDREIAFFVYNGFLSWWNFTGLGGMVSFIGVCMISIKNGWCTFRARDPMIGLMGLGLLVAFSGWMINQFTTADQLVYLSSVESASFFFILIGLMAAAGRLADNSNQISSRKRLYIL